MNFSQRMGLAPIRYTIQIDSIDEPLRNKLWNILDRFISYMTNNYHRASSNHHLFVEFIHALWNDYFNQTIDTIPPIRNDIKLYIRNHFMTTEWYNKYDFIEFLITHFPIPSATDGFIQEINSVLEDELSGYRIVGTSITPITSEHELIEIDKVIKHSEDNQLEGVRIHINSALQLLSNKTAPDYRNVIKESISALESLIFTLTNQNNFNKGIKKLLKDEWGIHKGLLNGFDNIYGYVSDDDGIRHALTTKSELDQEDAIYMLVSCSAFINYIIAKSIKKGKLTLQK